jgi:hypothetical protein
MEEKIKDAFELYYKTFSQIFEIFYPTTGSDGFVERNLTNNYVNQLSRLLEDDKSFCWYELSIPKSGNGTKKGHIDAVLFSPKYESIFYFEAKRLSTFRGNFYKRVESITTDFKKIIDEENRDSIKSRVGNEFKNEYIICLADFWISDDYKEIPIKKWIEVDNKNIVYLSKKIDNEMYYDKAILNYQLHLAYYKIGNQE